jgi:hypothetical protein
VCDTLFNAAQTKIMGILATAMKKLHEEYPLIAYNIYSANTELVRQSQIRQHIIQCQ